jgi:hypothetical protein
MLDKCTSRAHFRERSREAIDALSFRVQKLRHVLQTLDSCRRICLRGTFVWHWAIVRYWVCLSYEHEDHNKGPFWIQ